MLEKFKTEAKQTAKRLGHKLGSFKNVGPMHAAQCKKCQAHAVIQINDLQFPIAGDATFYKCS